MYSDRRKTLGVLDINSQIPQSFSSSTKPNKNRLSLGGSSASGRGGPLGNSNINGFQTNNSQSNNNNNRQAGLGGAKNLASELRNLSIGDSQRQSFGG